VPPERIPPEDDVLAHRFEVRVDRDAPLGDFLGPLAKLLLQMARRELAARKEVKGKPKLDG
jgi:hypothetical protein